MSGSKLQHFKHLLLPVVDIVNVFIKYSLVMYHLLSCDFAFSALTLLVGCQEGHPARKNLSDEVLAWLSSGAKCK